MQLFRWKTQYSIGIDYFDRQHMNLLNIINLTQMNLIQGVGNDKVVEILLEMIQYARYHFKAEEIFMDKIGYAKITKHQKGHQTFIDRIQEARKQMDQQKMDAFWIILKLNNYLQMWLIDHIQGMDKDFGQYYQSQSPVCTDDLMGPFESQCKDIWEILKKSELPITKF